MKIETVKDLIEALKKFPSEYKVDLNVGDAYTSYVRSVYANQYEKKHGRDVVTIKIN